MIDVQECTVLSTSGAITAHVTVQNATSQTFARSILTLQMFNDSGRMVEQQQILGGAISPGVQTLTFQTPSSGRTFSIVKCALQGLLSRWATTASGISPFRLEEPPQEPTPPTQALLPTDASPVVVPVPEPMEDDASNPVAPEPDPPSPARDPGDPWHLLEDGAWEAAAERFRAMGLDTGGRRRVQQMINSEEPEQIRLGVMVCRWSRWSAPMLLVKLLQHDHPAVRLEAVDTLGRIVGPSMLRYIEPMLHDPDEAVAAAAALAVKRINGLQPR
ncbi:MAG: HEAT repeat domain-containing protein [Myxococcota bacterium]